MHIVAEKLYTLEDLLSMPDRKNYELVDGHLVERTVSQLSSWVGGELHFNLRCFLRDDPIGWVWPSELGYACYPGAPNKVRKPDVSFIRIERMPDGPTSEGYAYIPPDLAVEVVSPNDLWHELEAKVEEYLAAGVSLVWVIDPEVRTAYVHRRDGTVSRLREGDELSGEDIIPGFRCPLASIFPKRPQAQGPQTAG
jgi:Uma2 family endonuclease